MALAFFAATALWLFHPAATSMWDHVFATPGGLQADGYLITWVMAWDCHALWNAPWQLFNANSFFPARNTLAGSEHMLGHLPLFAPPYAVTGNPSLAIQFTRLATVTLCAVSMFVLLRHWGAGVAAALFAGFVYGFCPARYGTVHALQLIAMPYLPLAIVYLDRALDRGRFLDGLLLALFFGLQMLCSFYLAYMTAISVGVYSALALLFRWRSGRPLHIAAPFAGGAAALLAMALSALPYTDLAAKGAIPEQADALLATFSASPWSTYATRPGTGRFARLGQAYVGILPAALCLYALWSAKRGQVSRCAVVACAAVAATMYVLSLGPYGSIGEWRVPLPYKWASTLIPGFSSMRVPLRFTFGLMFGVAALAGFGMQALLSSTALRRRPVVATAVATAAVMTTGFDYRHLDYRAQLRPVVVPGAIPPAYRVLGDLEPGPLLEVPVAIQGEDGFGGLDREARYQYLSSFHWFPILNGYTGYAPASAPIIKRIAKSLPGQRPLTLLRRMTGLRYVLVHLDQIDRELRSRWRRPQGLSLIGQYGSDRLFEVTGSQQSDLLASVVRSRSESDRTLLGHRLQPLPLGSAVRISVIRPDFGAARVVAGLPLSATLAIENRSELPWPVLTELDRLRVEVEYVWIGGDGMEDPGRLPLPYDLEPGESLSMVAAIPGPARPGVYRLTLAIVQGDRRFGSPLVVDRVEAGEWPAS